VIADHAKLAAEEAPPGLSPADAESIRGAIARAFVEGFRAFARASCVLALCAALCAWVWIGRGRSGAEGPEGVGS